MRQGKPLLFSFMAVCYILYSEKLDRYYLGATNNLDDRLRRHNAGTGKFTSKGCPWKVLYTEHFDTMAEAMKREREIKKKKSRKYIEWLVTTG